MLARPHGSAERKPGARVEPGRPPGRLWAVVLAGGEGMRLRPLTRRVCGDERPKQYAALVGSRSLLRQTLDRVALAIPAERTLVVTLRAHAPYIAAELAGAGGPRVLAQPEDRGTAAGVLLPAHWIHAHEPAATVAVFPSDHFVLEDRAFMDHVLAVAALADRRPEALVLLGARATSPETDYGWIEPGEPADWAPVDSLRRVRRFWEKPSAETARACFAGGCLWNTLVVVARAAALVEAGGALLPALHERLAGLLRFWDTEDEPWAIRQALELAPRANFSRSILEPCPAGLVVSTLPPLTWSDWGTPERVLRTLRGIGVRPPWLDRRDQSA
jgi:mannose-1-phosphate guanylyltransferase